MSNDDWRLHIDVADEGLFDHLRDLLQEVEIVAELRERLPAGLTVSRDGTNVFLYGTTGTDVDYGCQLIERLAADHELEIRVESQRWHPDEERWEAATVPMPDAAGREREHAALMAQEARETADAGYAEWEVRIEFPNHHEAREFAERLAAEGIPNRRAWTWLRIGAATEDDAVSLADRLRGELPADATILAPMGSATEIWRMEHPLWYLGGLAN